MNLRFNRTFMELKLSYNDLKFQTIDCFNRTFMELKFLQQNFLQALMLVLIVPLWN